MALISTPNEYSVEGLESTSGGNQRVVMTQNFSGTQQGYSEMSTECIVEDEQGHKQRCVCVKNFATDVTEGVESFNGETGAITANVLPAYPTTNGQYRIRATVNNGVTTLTWVAE